MRTHSRVVLVAAVSTVLSAVLTAQILVRQEAPTDRAVDFPRAEIEATIAQMDADARSTVRLLEGGQLQRQYPPDRECRDGADASANDRYLCGA